MPGSVTLLCAGVDLSRSQPDALQCSSSGASGLLGSVPDMPGMPVTRKVSFGSLGGQTPGGSQHGSPRGGSQRAAKGYWDNLHADTGGPERSKERAASLDMAGPARGRDSSDLGVQEMRELMRRLNFSKYGSTP